MRYALSLLFAVAPMFSYAAPVPGANARSATPMEAARKALDEVGDMNYQNKSLNELIGDLKSKTKVNVAIDPMVYQFGLDLNQPTLMVTLKQVKLKDGLRQALEPFNLTCGLTKDGLFISTEDGLIAKQLRQRVNVDCDGTAFGTIVRQLAADCGANVVIDPRLKEKANASVTLKLDDVPLETAIRLLAEVADLGAVRMNNVLFVTTAERAEKLRPASDGPTQPGGGGGGGVVPFPGGGGLERVVPLPPVIGLPMAGGVPDPKPAKN